MPLDKEEVYNEGKPCMVVELTDDSFVVFDLTERLDEIVGMIKLIRERFTDETTVVWGFTDEGAWACVPMKSILMVTLANLPKGFRESVQ